MSNYNAMQAHKRFQQYVKDKKKPTRNGMFQGTTFVTGAELDAQDAQKRAIELEKLKQAGEIKKIGLEQSGANNRANIQQKGVLAVTDRGQLGETKRQGMKTSFDREKFAGNQANESKRFGLDQQRQNFGMFDAMNKATKGQMDEYGNVTPGTPFSESNKNWSKFTKGPYIDDAVKSSILAGGGDSFATVGRADGTTQSFKNGILQEANKPTINNLTGSRNLGNNPLTGLRNLGNNPGNPNAIGFNSSPSTRAGLQATEDPRYKDYYAYQKRIAQVGKKPQTPPPTYIGLPWQNK